MDSTSSTGTLSQDPQPPALSALPQGHSEVRNATFGIPELYQLILSIGLSSDDKGSLDRALQCRFSKTSPYYEEACGNTSKQDQGENTGLSLSTALSKMDEMDDETTDNTVIVGVDRLPS